MKKKEIAKLATKELKELYPNAICSLEYADPFQLLVATRLSAQCTDARVNIVTPSLFEKYPSSKEMANADIDEIEKLIYSCGFYKTKAKNLIDLSKSLEKDYDGIVPNTMEDLTSLSGVGRKTANLILGDIFKMPAVVADTHLIRISNRLGLTNSKNPTVVERELKKLLDPKESNDFCHRCVLHGRAICKSQKPKCKECSLNHLCKNKVLL